MIDMPVKKAIAVLSPSVGRLVVNVRFENVANFDVFVLRDPPPLFVASGGTDIDEIGPSEKRKPYTLEDYERLAPGKATERSQEITSQFAWLPGRHTYEVSISGNYQDPVDHRIWKGRRFAAKFDWEKKT